MPNQVQATTILGTITKVAVKVRTKKPGEFLQGLMVVLIFGAMMAEALLDTHMARSWLICVALLAFFIAALGLWIMGDATGVLISNRNLVSMSRMQIILWTLIIFPSIFVLAAQKAHYVGGAQALDFGIPREVWGALGISLASLVGTPLLLQPKTDQVPSDKALAKTQAALSDPNQQISAQQISDQSLGTLFSNPHPSDARISDMFQGDEVGNAGYVDPAKVQMFVLTLVLVLTYAASLWSMFAGITISSDAAVRAGQLLGIKALPTLSPSQIAVLGISHAGYLTSKAVSHTDQN
jgi:hypothetical protein